MKPTIGARPANDRDHKLWQQALEELRWQMTKATYQTWLAHSYVIGSTDVPASLTIAVGNYYAKEWLTQHLKRIANQIVSAIAGRPVTVSFVVEPYPKENPMMSNQESQNQADLDLNTDAGRLIHGTRQTRRIDSFLAKAGIIPTYALERPTNITIDDILLRGGRDPMTDPNNPTRVRIYSHITQGTFLHVEDALNIGKLRLFAGRYQRGVGITAHTHHFLDTADARVVLLALAQAEPGFTYREYKGSANDGMDVISRVFLVKSEGNRVHVELKNGSGRLTDTGLIQPTGEPRAEITIPFKTYEARRLAVEVLAYLQAWDVLRLTAHRELISGLPPYLLAPPPLDGNRAESTADAPDRQDLEATMAMSSDESVNEAAIEESMDTVLFSDQVVQLDDNKFGADGRSEQIDEESFGPSPSATSSSQVLYYQDGTLVHPHNENERKAFLQCRKKNGEDPSSLASLRRWYKQNKTT